MKNKRLLFIFLIITIIFLIPLIAMQFSSEVNWTRSDFVVMGILLLSVGLICEFIFRKISNPKHRIIIFFIVLLLFIIIWAELAVGLFGTPFAGS
jgi:hypothetical protein